MVSEQGGTFLYLFLPSFTFVLPMRNITKVSRPYVYLYACRAQYPPNLLPLAEAEMVNVERLEI